MLPGRLLDQMRIVAGRSITETADVTFIAMARDFYTVAIGFSIVCAITLMAAYLVARLIPKKTPFAIASCIALSTTMVLVQYWHLQQLLYDVELLSHWPYRLAVFIAPGLFFYFARALTLPDAPLSPALALHLVPAVIAMLLPNSAALLLVLGVGTGYALWLSWLVVATRQHYRQMRMERIFAGLITLGALLVFAAGVFGGASSFYRIYGLSIAGTYVMVLFALVAIPDFVNELFEQTQLRYAVSTLGDVDIAASLDALDQAMTQEHLYRDESLSLSSLAERVSLNSHQLSELLNRHLEQSFSQYLRSHRLQAAKRLLRSQRQQSVLSIALETGFRSQSTFYAAFKDAFGMSPGAFRDQNKPSMTPE